MKKKKFGRIKASKTIVSCYKALNVWFVLLFRPVNMCITNASGHLVYGMLNQITQGNCLGEDVEVNVSSFLLQANVMLFA